MPLEPSRLRETVEYHRDKLGYSADDLAKLLAVNAADIQATYFDRPSVRLAASN